MYSCPKIRMIFGGGLSSETQKYTQGGFADYGAYKRPATFDEGEMNLMDSTNQGTLCDAHSREYLDPSGCFASLCGR